MAETAADETTTTHPATSHDHATESHAPYNDGDLWGVVSFLIYFGTFVGLIAGAFVGNGARWIVLSGLIPPGGSLLSILAWNALGAGIGALLGALLGFVVITIARSRRITGNPSNPYN